MRYSDLRDSLAFRLGDAAEQYDENSGPGYGLGDLQAVFEVVDAQTTRKILEYERTQEVLFDNSEYEELADLLFDERGAWIGWQE